MLLHIQPSSGQPRTELCEGAEAHVGVTGGKAEVIAREAGNSQALAWVAQRRVVYRSR